MLEKIFGGRESCATKIQFLVTLIKFCFLVCSFSEYLNILHHLEYAFWGTSVHIINSRLDKVGSFYLPPRSED